MTLPSDSTFFGLTLDYNLKIFDQIFELVYYSKGAFDYTSIYEMPVNLRGYYYMKLVEIEEYKAEKMKEANTKGRRR